MAAPNHAYTDPTAGVETLRLADPIPSMVPPLVAWTPLANPVDRARSVGEHLEPSPIQAPEVVCAAPQLSCWSEASQAFFVVWSMAVRALGWQRFPR